uniref:5'-3' DNA helicase ZGRF1-like N-terminal domain-containing protein n=1 Tax=Manihot esculenta TaxID=3983 RepID=A0A2C9WHZ7_MANES
MTQSTCEILWINHLLKEIGMDVASSTKLYPQQDLASLGVVSCCSKRRHLIDFLLRSLNIRGEEKKKENYVFFTFPLPALSNVLKAPNLELQSHSRISAMENLKKRWTVTYTKQIKQKRKVYQDGFLDLHVSTNKVMLFDDCEKLLECRMLKGEEVVSSGETLTFNGYLVDVGDLEGDVDQKPNPDLNLYGKERKILEKPRPRPSLMYRHKFTSPSISSDEKDTAKKSKAPLNNLSPSQKIIRAGIIETVANISEFKKSELQRYGALRSYQESPDTVNPHVTEWQVMYTTQVTQKAKKYHDGFLRLTKSGSLGRQIMLYDASRKLLDSRFLKKNEIVRSHESVIFDAHLVDIGEPELENQLSADLNVQGNNINLACKERVMHVNQNCLRVHESWAKATEKFQSNACSREDTDSRSKFAVERTKVSNTAHTDKSLRGIHQILSILQKPLAQKSVVVGCTDNSMTTTVFSAKVIHISDAEVDYPKDGKLPVISLPNDGPSETKDNGESTKFTDNEKCSNLMPSEDISISSGGQPSSDSVTGNFDQLKSTREIDEWPTFDLGF